MMWQHFKAIAWLRWRLSVNMWKRGGSLNAILGALLLAACTVLSVFSFFIALAIGIFAFRGTSPDDLLLVWDVVVVVFLFMWTMGLVTELQKSEVLSLEKLLHLPVSPTGAYLLNYLSSWISLTLLLFLPSAAGMSLALVIVKGPAMLILFPLVLSFVIMVTALSHQFRGWLQVLMVNKRRRRTIIALVTGSFILLCQVPNLVNLAVHRSRRNEGPSEYEKAVDELHVKLGQGEIDSQQYQHQESQLKEQQEEKKKKDKAATFNQVVKTAMIVNMILPIGWLPVGAQSAAAGAVWPGLLGTLGAVLIGAASLRRSYRTTLRLYTGGFGSGRKKKAQPVRQGVDGENFLERRFAWVPDQAAVVMLGGLRSMLRGPEGKMLLIAPFMLLGFFSIFFFMKSGQSIPEQGRPFLGLGVVSMTLICFVQALCNQFGFDRHGFRALLLSPCPRRYILLGKNLAVAPLAIVVGSVALAAAQYFVKLSFMHILATVLQLLTAYLIFCMLGNLVSVIAPSAVANGALKPGKAKFLTVLIHVFAALFSPVAVAPAAILLVVDLGVQEAGWMQGGPIYLIGTLVEMGIVIWLYRLVLPLQARLFQQREHGILEAVTARTE